MNEKLIEKLAEEIQAEWDLGGLFDGIYRQFFIELFTRYEKSVGVVSSEWIDPTGWFIPASASGKIVLVKYSDIIEIRDGELVSVHRNGKVIYCAHDWIGDEGGDSWCSRCGEINTDV